jgi:lysophospholipase L1-like esterase
MSVDISYKKQSALFLILIVVVFFVVEGSARTYEFFVQDCNLENAESLNNMDYFLKRQICYDQQNLIYSANPVLSLIPNQHLSTVNINNDGFRGPELELYDTYRVFVIGGSTVFGAGLPSDEFTISAQLENFLRKDMNNIEVINAGVSSITSFEELYHIKDKILKYDPDMIIIYDGVNDIFYKKIVEPKITNNEEDELKNYQRYLRSPVVFYRYFILPLINYEILDSPGKHYPSDNYNHTTSEKLSLLWEKRMSDFCKLSVENNFTSVVIVQPALYNGKKPLSIYEESIYETNTHGEKTFEKLIEKSNTLNNCSLVLDLSYVFENTTEDVYFDQVHTNSLGNQIIAKKIYHELIHNKII